MQLDMPLLLLLITVIALFGYLFLAFLYPEKFIIVVAAVVYLGAILILLTALAYYLGGFINSSFITIDYGHAEKLDKAFRKIEEPIFKYIGVSEKDEMYSKTYIKSLLLVNIVIFFVGLALFFNQEVLKLGEEINKLSWDATLHTLFSYITNTDQTHCIPEIQFTFLTKYFTLPLLMFTSSATGISTAVMFIRSITVSKVGNFYIDFIKSLTRILIPLSILISIIFTASGTPNTIESFLSYETLEGAKEHITIGAVAAFQAIKIIGQNGGSLYNVNSAHPFSNPSYISNFLQIIFMLLIPSAFLFTLGHALNNKKQSFIIFIALFLVLSAESLLSTKHELNGNQIVNSITETKDANINGKETRFGVIGSSLYIIAASNASGATNSSIEAYHPITTAIAYFNLCIQAIFGGQGLGPIYIIIFMLYTAYFCWVNDRKNSTDI